MKSRWRFLWAALVVLSCVAPVVGAAVAGGCGSSAQTVSAGASWLRSTPAAPVLSADRGLVVFDGCSLVADAGVATADGMPEQVMSLLPSDLQLRNLGVAGQTTQQMAADAASQVDPLYCKARAENVLVVWEGTNDLIYGVSPRFDSAQAYRHLADYCRARRRAGFTVVICSVLPRAAGADFAAARRDLNARLRRGWPQFADAIADVGADMTIGPEGAQWDRTYYRDGVHLTPAGYAIVARHVATAVKSVL